METQNNTCMYNTLLTRLYTIDLNNVAVVYKTKFNSKDRIVMAIREFVEKCFCKIIYSI